MWCSVPSKIAQQQMSNILPSTSKSPLSMPMPSSPHGGCPRSASLLDFSAAAALSALFFAPWVVSCSVFGCQGATTRGVNSRTQPRAGSTPWPVPAAPPRTRLPAPTPPGANRICYHKTAPSASRRLVAHLAAGPFAASCSYLSQSGASLRE